MESIKVRTSENYMVYVGNNILNTFFEELKHYKNTMIISDDVVWNLYRGFFEKKLEENDISYKIYVVKNGEKSKSVENYIKINEFMLQNNFSRQDAVVAFGGGVIGDLAGFISSTYMRGIDIIQLPTTLLAMVDSSVGGKTAINLLDNKNIIGSFKQPKSVYCDINFLQTLQEDTFAEGIAEVVKYAILFDRELFNILLNKITKKDLNLEDIVKKCISFKAKVVEKDEFDLGQRKLLNLGHTIGHAIEKLTDNKISHGFAVSIGIYFIAKLSHRIGKLNSENVQYIKNVLEINNLPTNIEFSVDDFYKSSISDKKASKDDIEIILINNIGDCDINKISLSKWKEYICLVLENDDKYI